MFNSTKKSLSDGICSEKIIEPSFFENNDGKAVSINGGRYKAMMSDFLTSQMHELGVESLYFQQNDAPYIVWYTQSLLCVKCFLDACYRNLAISGHRDRSIWHRWISFCGATSKARFISIVYSLFWKSTYRKKLSTFLPKHCATLWKVLKIEPQLGKGGHLSDVIFRTWTGKIILMPINDIHQDLERILSYSKIKSFTYLCRTL